MKPNLSILYSRNMFPGLIEAKRFFSRALLFLLLQLFCLFCILSSTKFVQDHLYSGFTAWTCDSPVRTIPRNKNFQYVVLGSSRAKAFHLNIERTLGAQVLNIAKTGAGVVVNAIILDVFFDKGNSTKNLIYFIDPFAFLSPTWNEDYSFANSEALDWDLFQRLIEHRMNRDLILQYVTSKVSWKWLLTGPSEYHPATTMLTKVDPKAVEGRLKGIYPSGPDPKQFERYSKVLDQMLSKANRLGVENIYLIKLPTLLGEEPGMNYLKDHIQKLAIESGMKITFRDLTDALTPIHFGDHDHLNTPGGDFFVKQYLAPLLTHRD